QINNATAMIGAGAAGVYSYSDKQADLLSITRLRVDADLTDNVMATVRLLNERNWNGESVNGTAEANRNIGLTVANTASTENQIDLDLAYVTVKEFFYSPLSVKVGRQELHFGNDWIVGDPDTNMVATKSSLAEGDLSARKSFDAIRATLDYNPVVVDLIYAKLAENNSVLNDDTTLTGLNTKYDMRRDTMLEGFFFSKIKGRDTTAPTHADGIRGTDWDALGAASGPTNKFKDKTDEVYTVGGRVVNSTVKNLTVDLSAAYQFGTYNPKYDVNAGYTDTASEHANTVNRRAWGAELIGSYDLSGISMIEKYSPMVKGAYIYLSGDTNDRKDSGTANKKYSGWDAMYENQTFGHILNAIMGFTNCQLGGLSFQAKPVSDLTAKLDYAAAWFNKRYAPGRQVILSGVEGARLFTMDKTPFIGQEVDLTLTYDYTEDVQFSLLGGVFMPSKALNMKDSAQRTTKTNAVEVIGSMKVTF
ncbi:MAG: alginate export family protein, partial [Candidatus Omnitrophota bacterium]|nr:alginate export family protein [Candidatus Omnitrophota bacterium]